MDKRLIQRMTPGQKALHGIQELHKTEVKNDEEEKDEKVFIFNRFDSEILSFPFSSRFFC